MALSANTLFHFTSSSEKLKSILQDNFRISYCRESIFEDGDERTSFWVPMVSFCNIPMSELGAHLDSYGSYGLGLNADWRQKKRLNPVMYLSEGSMLWTGFLDAVFETTGNLNEIDKGSEGQRGLANILRYMKPHEGVLARAGQTTRRSYRFSDEREWRFVPPFSPDFKMMLGSPPTANDKQALEGLRLKFEPKDISYIIIKSDDEIHDFLDHLRAVKGRTFTHAEIELLNTRILTAERIEEDM